MKNLPDSAQTNGKPSSSKFNAGQKLAIWLILLLFLGLTVVYVYEFPYFNNTFQIKGLIFRSLLIGALPAALLAFLAVKKVADGVEKIQIFLMIFVPILVFAPLFGSLSNRLLSSGTAQMEKVEYWETQGRVVERFGKLKGEKPVPNTFLLFFNRNGNLERVKTKKHFFENAERGDTVEIPVKPGFWGFDWVEFE